MCCSLRWWSSSSASVKIASKGGRRRARWRTVHVQKSNSGRREVEVTALAFVVRFKRRQAFPCVVKKLRICLFI